MNYIFVKVCLHILLAANSTLKYFFAHPRATVMPRHLKIKANLLSGPECNLLSLSLEIRPFSCLVSKDGNGAKHTIPSQISQLIKCNHSG